MPTMFGWLTAERKRRSSMAFSIACTSPCWSTPFRTHGLRSRLWSSARYTQPRPPCARQPTISYCSLTRSPARSRGTNENGVWQRGQNPLVSPGAPSRVRPTAVPQSGFAQNRWSSATCGSVRTAAEGSGDTMGGSATNPPPKSPFGPDVIDVPTLPERLEAAELLGGTGLLCGGAGRIVVAASCLTPHRSHQPSASYEPVHPGVCVHLIAGSPVAS